MTFIYERDQYLLEIYQMTENHQKMNFLRQGFLNLSHYRHIDKQTDATETICHAASRVVSNSTVWIKLAKDQGGHRCTTRLVAASW